MASWAIQGEVKVHYTVPFRMTELSKLYSYTSRGRVPQPWHRQCPLKGISISPGQHDT